MKAALLVLALTLAHAQPGLGQLLDGADFLNGLTGWVSWGNVLYQTTDGGESWDRRAKSLDIVAVEFATDSIGWAAVNPPPLKGTRILKTEDGGRSWIVQKGFNDRYEIFGLHVLSTTTVYSVGTIWGTADCTGRILMTRDGGSTWSEVYAGRADLFSGWFLDTNQGVATGLCFGDASIVTTSDGGDSWIERYPQEFGEIRNVQLVDSTHGFFLGFRKGEDRPALYATTDAFDSWIRKAGSVDVFSALDNQNILAINESAILRSSDGGTTWEETYTATSGLIWIQYVDSSVAWAVGRYGWVLESVDGGVTWIGRSTPWAPDSDPSGWAIQFNDASSFFTDVSVTDANTAIVVGSDGTILRTEDAGTVWVNQDSGVDASLEAVTFTDANTGTAVGENGTILRTTDGGTTWAKQTSGTSRHLMGVSFTDANTGTAVGDSGTILRTTDGGTTWVSQTSDAVDRLQAVSFTDANTGTVVGAGIFRTIDGGATWVSQTIEAQDDFFSGVSFADANTGSVVSWMGSILRTTDGGTTWELQAETGLYLMDVDFTDANTGTAVGGRSTGWFGVPPIDGVILRTTDGGETWVSHEVPTDVGYIAVDFSDADNGVAVGYQGSILCTNSGGIATATEREPSPDSEMPRGFVLYQNYPNPFSPATTISYDLPRLSVATLTVYDVLGRTVRELASGTQQAGRYEVSFDAAGLPSGIYFYRLRAEDYVETKRMVVVK